jgi:hypothetical protein
MLFLRRSRRKLRQQVRWPSGQTTVVDELGGTTTVVLDGSGLRSTLMQEASGKIKLSRRSVTRMEPPIMNIFVQPERAARGSRPSSRPTVMR